MLPALSNQMFLGAPIDEYVQHVNQTHDSLLNFAKKLNEVAHRALFCAKVTRTDLQHVLLAALLQRGMKTFQAAVLLAERGLPEEAQVALRTLLEVTFKTMAVAKSNEVALAFVAEDETHRRKFINKYKLLSASAQDPAHLSELETLLDATAKRIRETGATELKTYWFAEKAGLLDLYNSAYAVLSSTTHVGVRTLESALDIGPDGLVARMKYGFSDAGIEATLATAFEALLMTLHAGFSKGDIPQEVVDELGNMKVAFDSLHSQLKDA